MPGLGSKGKGAKGNAARPARSRNSTPGSVSSVPPMNHSNGQTALLDIQLSSLAVPSNVLYEDVLERHKASSGLPDSRHLCALIEDLKTLGTLAGSREIACDKAIRELSIRRSGRQSYDRETETLHRAAEERAALKRGADGDEVKDTRTKRRKDHKVAKEDRPLVVGAHGLAKQDGSLPSLEISSKQRGKVESGSSSPLSPPSQIQSPVAETSQAATTAEQRPGSSSSSSSEDSHQPPPAPSVPQYQTFGVNPLTFDDPTIYHIRDIEDDMTDEEKKEIYCVAMFPRSDLKELTAGTPPDKDFSNAKPSNQVAATTFGTYLEPYMRPFGDEDVAFLKERGDRGGIFTVNARGSRSYKEIWAEEDGHMSVEKDTTKLASNQARGSLDQMSDEVAQTEQVSLGPVTERIMALMKSERRPPADDKDGDAGQQDFQSIDISENNTSHQDDGEVSASNFSESNRTDWKIPLSKVDYASIEERLKQELRYIGFLGPEDEPSFEGHWDDEVAERARILQTELRRVSIENGARKALLLEKVKEHMAHQEFQTIQDDLDQQIVQAFLKRNRTLNKPSKNKKRPGISSTPASGPGPGIGKPGIGDVARTLIDRRRRWMDTLQGIFDEDFTKAKAEDDELFTADVMKERKKAEEDNWDEEGDLAA